MGLAAPEKSWTEFARQERADIKYHARANRKTNSRWTVDKQAEFKIDFIWNVEPNNEGRVQLERRTDFFFSINSENTYSFEMYSNDFFTRLALIFNSKKIKIGDEDLDRNFVFISNDQQRTQAFAEFLKSFLQNRKTNFIIMVEGNGLEGTGKRLLIQVNELLIEKSDIELFFKLGSEMQQIINKRF